MHRKMHLPEKQKKKKEKKNKKNTTSFLRIRSLHLDLESSNAEVKTELYYH